MSEPRQRNLLKKLKESAGYYPVVTVTGPRQSGKTTLCQLAFPDKPRVSLEPLDIREYAKSDPRGFLSEHRDGAVIDEVQRAPELLSYLQEEVDREPAPGRFVLTGSQHFALMEDVSQSLAGRTAVHELLPPSLEELRRFGPLPESLFEVLWAGAYPRIHDRKIPPHRWLADYVTTYVQRDVRSVLEVGDLGKFTTFVKVFAGRTAQELRLSSVGSDVGVSHNTIRSWLSVLETSMLCFRLPPFKRNVRRQWVKAPKVHFFDSGLICYLLGIREPEQLRHHPLRGAIFESWVAAEIYKSWAHRGKVPPLFHLRESRGLEVDLLVEGEALKLVEMKSGQTAVGDFFKPLNETAQLLERHGEDRRIEKHLVFGGADGQKRSDGNIVPWSSLDGQDWG